jgi:hypothetical protein
MRAYSINVITVETNLNADTVIITEQELNI